MPENRLTKLLDILPVVAKEQDRAAAQTKKEIPHIKSKDHLAISKGPGVDFGQTVARLKLLAESRLQADESQDPEIHDVVRREEESAKEVGYASRLLVQATLPHSKPEPGVFEFERSNGFTAIKIIADSSFGLPYGTYPRLISSWLTTEAVRTKSPIIEMGDSFNQFMSKMNLSPRGGSRGNIARLRDHIIRLFASHVSATYRREGELQRLSFSPVEEISMFWDPTCCENMFTWRSAVSLNRRFFEEITRKPVPIDTHVLRALAKSRSPLALDIYQWLTHRLSYLREAAIVPWGALQLQFGVDYVRPRKFKEKFLQHLKEVLQFYPQANVEVTERGLLLRPSKTHVPKRLIRSKSKQT